MNQTNAWPRARGKPLDPTAEAARAGTIVRDRALAQRAELRGMIARAPGYLSGDECGADSARVAAQAQAGPCAEFVSDDI